MSAISMIRLRMSYPAMIFSPIRPAVGSIAIDRSVPPFLFFPMERLLGYAPSDGQPHGSQQPHGIPIGTQAFPPRPAAGHGTDANVGAFPLLHRAPALPVPRSGKT